MKHKPIRVDWNELEVAFTNHDEEIVYYLDLVTGHVILDGEGEELDDEDDFSTGSVPSARPSARDDSTRAYVVPLSTETKLGWMDRFLAEKDNGLDDETNVNIRQAYESENAAEELGTFLRAADEARDIWYLYRSDRLHEQMQQWLDDNGIKAIDPAPWT